MLQEWSDIGGYYSDTALVRTKTLKDTFIKAKNSLSKFSLEVSNFSFLDLTWERPIFRYKCYLPSTGTKVLSNISTFRQHELVPCRDLGLMVCSVEGYIIVTKVKPYSVAGEDDKVEVGDNLVSIDGVML